MYKKLLAAWLVTSVFIILGIYIVYDTKLFFPAVIFIFTSIVILTFLKTRSIKLVSYCFLSALIFSVLSTISFLDNYIRSQIEDQDGIAITNTLTYLFLGEDGWSKELFRSAYELSFNISIVLLISYIMLVFFMVYKNDKN